MEETAVLGEEAVSQPLLEPLAGEADRRQQPLLEGGGPVGAVGGGQEGAEPLAGRQLPGDRGEADDAVLVGVGVQAVGLLLGPAVAEESGDSDLERLGGAGRVALEEPLGGVVTAWLPAPWSAGTPTHLSGQVPPRTAVGNEENRHS